MVELSSPSLVCSIDLAAGGEAASGRTKGAAVRGRAAAAGGMVSACPAGALEITDHDVHFIHFANLVDIAKLFVIGGVGLLVLASLAGGK